METKAVIYTRFSPRKNADDSESCEVQAAYCDQYAHDRGYVVTDTFDDKSMSGNDRDRPGLRQAIAKLTRGGVLLVYKRDRLARDVLLAELTRRQVKAVRATIEAVKGDIEGDDENPTVMFIRQVMDAVAELERKQIGERTRDAMQQHQRNGKRMGRYAPYGWRICESDPEHIEPREDEQPALDRIAELANENKSPYAITRIMNDEMPEASRTGKWNTRTMTRIVRRL